MSRRTHRDSLVDHRMGLLRSGREITKELKFLTERAAKCLEGDNGVFPLYLRDIRELVANLEQCAAAHNALGNVLYDHSVGKQTKERRKKAK